MYFGGQYRDQLCKAAKHWRAVRSGIDVTPLRSMCKTAYYRLVMGNVLLHHNTAVYGAKNVEINGLLTVGIGFRGILDSSDRTLVRVRGKLIIEGTVHLGKGCRIDIGPNAKCVLNNCSITGLSNLVIANGLQIGMGSVVSWGCEFLDEDWHKLDYAGRGPRDPRIVIGEKVWVGSHVKILKGVSIGSGSVVACGAVVTKSFPEAVLIAGNPARIIRTGIGWS